MGLGLRPAETEEESRSILGEDVRDTPRVPEDFGATARYRPRLWNHGRGATGERGRPAKGGAGANGCKPSACNALQQGTTGERAGMNGRGQRLTKRHRRLLFVGIE